MSDMKGAVVGVNWETEEVEIKFLTGDDVPRRAQAGISAYHRSSGGHDKWTRAYVPRELRDPDKSKEVIAEFNKHHAPFTHEPGLFINRLQGFLDDDQIAKVSLASIVLIMTLQMELVIVIVILVVGLDTKIRL